MASYDVRTQFILLLLLLAPLGGCKKVEAQAPSIADVAREGSYSFASSGYAIAFGEAVKKPSQDSKKTSMALSASGSMLIVESKDSAIIEFSNAVFALQDSSGGSQTKNSTTGWAIRSNSKLDGTCIKFHSSRELTTEELFATRCMVSYWKSGRPSGHQEEMDGTFGVTFLAGNMSWVSASPIEPALENMPNRTAVPITRRVAGDLTISPNRIHGERHVESYLLNNLVGANDLKINIQTKLSSHSAITNEYPVLYQMQEDQKSASNERMLQMKHLKGGTLNSILDSIPNKELPTQERNDRFLQLRALFYLEPSQCMPAVSRSLSANQTRLVAEALAGAATPAAQAALAKLLDANIGDHFYDLLALVVPITNLHESLEEVFMRAAFNDVTSDCYPAQLMVGSNVRRCLVANPEQARILSQYLTMSLSEAETSDQKINLLYALGNAGNTDCLDDQATYLTAKEPTVRAAAVHSFRHFSSTTALRKLTTLQSTEKDEKVLAELKRVIGAIQERQ